MFPPGMDYEVSYDVSAFLEASSSRRCSTHLFEADFVLVALVVFLFLGDEENWRSTLIPDPGGPGIADRGLLFHACCSASRST